MTQTSGRLPKGLAGLEYGVTQISLAVRDLDAVMERYGPFFGWAPWQVFDHVAPTHHRTVLRGQAVHYALRGAEVYVGSINFELLEPLEGPNLWSELMDQRGDGIASIATMFVERQDGDAVKRAFQETFGIDVIMKAEIGDHIEYYYLGTNERFGCLIESGSGHAIDFVKPARVYPSPDATPGPSPQSGLIYPITQLSIVVRDLPAKVEAWHTAFGWGPWRLYGPDALVDTTFRGTPASFEVRFAQVCVGDLVVELIEPMGGASPWQEFLEGRGEGIISFGCALANADEAARARAQFGEQGIAELASGRVGNRTWKLFDAEAAFACLIQTGDGPAIATEAPFTSYP